jgi:uncharacterized delta-60 repeat protein/uncharacterized repeat protein (TIGR02543 family)
VKAQRSNWSILMAAALLSLVAFVATGCSSSSTPPPPPTYTVTYDGNGSTGGSVPVDTAKYTAGSTVTVLGNTGTLVKTGFDFAGWNTLANATGTAHAPAATFAMGSANVTLYAVWAPLYTVTGTVTSSGSALAGVTITLSGGSTGSATTDASGAYSLSVTDGSYTLTPSKTGYGFAPASASLTVANANVTGKDFTAMPSGSLDASFGTGGAVTTAIGTHLDNAYAVAIQGDGKIVAAGSSFSGTTFDFALAQYNSDGSLDTSFGTGGKVTTPIGTADDEGKAIAIQGDGKIVVAGYATTASNHDFALARYTSAGSLDTSFGTGGMVTTDFGSNYDYANAVLLQADGKIVAAGMAQIGGHAVFALARYNSDGSLDTGFGTGGEVTTPIGALNSMGYAAALQSDGKIVIAGSSNNGSSFALVRYNSDGSLDTGFGTGGEVTTAIGTGNNAAFAVAIQGDGKIVVAGYSYDGTNNDFALVRYTSAGSLDTSFGTGGTVTTAIGTGAVTYGARSIVIQGDGKIVAAGNAKIGSALDFVLARYKSDGTPDTGFGTGGMVTTAIAAGDDYAFAVALQGDGKIVAAGNCYNGVHTCFGLARYWQ